MSTQQEEELTPLNVKIPASQSKAIRVKAVNLGLKLQIFVKGIQAFGLYIQENFGPKDTAKLSKEIYPIVCLKAARNDLAKQGCPAETTAKLDQVISEAEEFLETK